MKVIDEQLKAIDNKEVAKKAADYIKQMEEGERDFRF